MRTVQTKRSIKARNRKENSYKILLTFKDKKLMKKLLLSLVAILAAVNLSAKDEDEGGWMKNFTPVADAADLKGVHVAQAGDGSVYVSSSQNAEFTFGTSTVSASDLTGAIIVKYDKDGNEQWTTRMSGAATITTMNAAEDGTLYVAGTFTDEVSLILNEAPAVMASEDVISAFVGKVSKDGGFTVVKTFTPETDATIAAAMGDPWGDGEVVPLYSGWDPIYVTPTKIQVANGKVYVAARYTGDVPSIGWEGAYIDFGSYDDDISAGVFMLDAATLGNAQSLCYVQKTGGIGLYSQNYPEALSFTIMNETPVVGFFGYGDLTLTPGTGEPKDYTFAPGSHPFVLAAFLEEGLTSIEYTAAPHWKDAKPYKVFMEKAGDNVIIGGTFYGELPFDNSQTSGTVGTDGNDPTYAFNSSPFVASFNTNTGQLDWAGAAPLEANAIQMAVTGPEIHAATDKGIFTIETETGKVDEDKVMDVVLSDASAWKDDYAALVMANENTVVVKSMDMGDNGGGEGDGVNFGHWTKSIKPIAEGSNSDLKGLHTSVANDGSVYASMTYNQEFSFAGEKYSAPEDNMVSALVLKYNNEGDEQWAATFDGAVEVTAMANDIEGNLYVAASYEGAVMINAPFGQTPVAEGGSSFIAKIAPNGVVENVKTLSSIVDPTIGSLMGDPWDEGYEMPLYQAWDPIYVAPNKMKVYGDRLYVSATYKGDVPEFGWEGAYIDAWGMYQDDKSAGIFSLNTATLDDARNVLYLQKTGTVTDDQCFPEALNFDVALDGKIYYSFIGFGNQTVTLANGKSKNFTFNTTTDGSGNKEHALVVGITSDVANSKVYSAEMNDNSYPTYDIKNMMVDGGTIYMGGTFYGNFWFWPSTTLDYNAAFSAKFSLNNDMVDSNWSDMESECTAYAFEGGNIIASSSTEGTALIGNGGDNRVISKVALDDVANFFTAANGYICHDGVKVYVAGRYHADEAGKLADGIKKVTPAAVKKAVRYNIAGQRVDDSYKGFVIENGVTKLAK